MTNKGVIGLINLCASMPGNLYWKLYFRIFKFPDKLLKNILRNEKQNIMLVC